MAPQLLKFPSLAGGTTTTTVVISGKHTEKEVTITKASPAIKAMAGSLGGLMEACLLQPVDTIKTRMQLNPVLFPGMVSTGSSIVKTEGTKSLWKGLTPFATHLYLKYALRFGTNAGFQSLLMDKETGKLDAPRRVLAGLGAGVTEVGKEGGRKGFRSAPCHNLRKNLSCRIKIRFHDSLQYSSFYPRLPPFPSQLGRLW